ncbi:MAG: multi-sensor hybrid histidine kinase, partial [bacterium]
MPEKIFVVEDEFLVVRDLKNQLISLGYEVVGSTPLAEEALALTKTLKPNLVLMDIRLQGTMDGITAAENIRKTCKLPVVYLTANADDATLKRALVTEPFGYILKPFEERELKTVIEMALYKHRSECRLQESERRFATTLNSIGDAVIATDEKGIITFLNPVACSLTEWPLSEALGKPLAEVFHIINHFTRQPVDNPATLVLRYGQKVGLANNTILVSHNGQEIPIDDCASPIHDDEGNCTGVVLVFRDVTEKKKAEEQIQKSEARFRQLANAAPVMMWLTNTEQQHIFFSKPWLDFTGRTIAQECQQGWCVGVRQEDQERLFTIYDNAFLQRKPFQMEYQHKRHDGIYRWLLLTGVPIFTSNNDFDGFIGSCIDVTEHKHLEEKVQQIQKMESIGQLASGVAHDFNNLLMVINGYSSLLIRNIPKKHTWHTAAKEILLAGERAAELTRQLLIFSSKQMIQMKPLQLNKVINNMEKMLRRLIPENIALQTSLAKNLHIIEAD